ncbi:MAG TPA: hypothetical protein VHV83_09945 [Armatimonadota bacterium]|nr:hypothetical protein [Armatimonadota bacterium]
MRLYRYESPVGAFIIKPQPDGRWGLWLKDDLLGNYHSAVAAADDVYTQTTVDYDWDTYEGSDIPTDIHEWEVIVR